MDLRTELSGKRAAKPETVLRAVQGDITRVSDVEAIVNAANRSLLGGSGVDGAIHRAAGAGLLEECRKLHGCETGEAKLTGAYNLPCKYVIHTVGPVWQDGGHKEAEMLAACYRNALQVAVDHQIRSVAFPSISTGVFSYPLEEAAKVAVQAVNLFVHEHPGKLDLVEWVLLDAHTREVYEKALQMG
ncbi:MAG: O-acetyl-ADP-ribose deacetylase [Clostridia bacterium]|nr:O-acetyl-ADP-ribose deacetylase [Clostridia bacterium]